MAELVKNFLNKTNSKENREMLCNICNKYLSVPPILCNKLVGNICGRCEESTEVTKIKKLKNINSTMERQKVFECVSKYLTFPCSFRVNGCVAELKWGAVRAHEQNCSFQNTVCPFSNVQYLENDEEPCIWIGKSTELVSHFSRRHKNYFMNNFRVVLGIESSSIFGTLFGIDSIAYQPKFQSKINFTEMFGFFFIVVLSYHRKINRYLCQIYSDMSLHECSMFEYQLEILDESKTNSIVLPKAGIGSLRNYFHGKTVSESVLEIDLNYINKLLKMPHFIILDIKLINKKEVSKVITSAARCLPPRTQSFDDALPNIKCNRCGTHLWQNIHFCSSGHNVCVDCRWKLERCNSCSGSWCLERNVAMERLASLLSYPCENRAAGCLYTAPMPYIVDHQARCLHKLILSRECYVKQCDYRGHNFITHITERHLLLETDEFYPVKDEKYFFLYNGDIIALELDFLIDIDLKYSVICCRSAEVKYQYELQLIDSPNVTKTNAKLTLKQVCQPEYTSLDPSQILTHVPFSLLSQLFLNCAKLMFKLKVFPID